MAAALAFADLLAPMTPEAFFEDHHARRWAHVEGDRDKFGDLMPWDRFNDLLAMTAKWTGDSLRLSLDGRPVAPARYCESIGEGGGPAAMRPVASEVMALLRRGATLVARQIDTATPGIARIADALEAELGAKVDCSATSAARGRGGGRPRYELQDLYVVQLHGDQVWTIHDGGIEAPVPDAGFLHGARPSGAGAPAARVSTRPGDLLYLPRGQFHDAVPETGASLHLSFGVHAFTGLEFLQTVMIQAVHDPLFRRNFPRAEEGEDAFGRHLAALADRVLAIADDPDFAARFAAYQGTKRSDRTVYALPVDPDAPVYRLAGSGFRVEQSGARCVLVGPSGRVEIPEAARAPVCWIVEAGSFTEADLAESQPDLAADARAKLLEDLAEMRVIARA